MWVSCYEEFICGFCVLFFLVGFWFVFRGRDSTGTISSNVVGSVVDGSLGGRGYLLELILSVLDEGTGSPDVLFNKIMSKVKWFVDKVLNLPLSTLIYSGVVFVPIVFRVGSRDVVRVEGVLGKSLKDLGARSIGVVFNPTRILEYIEFAVKGFTGHNLIIDHKLIDELYGIARRLLGRTIALIHDLQQLSMAYKLSTRIPSLRLGFDQTILRRYLDLESRGRYIPLPVKTRAVDEDITGFLGSVEQLIRQEPRKGSRSVYVKVVERLREYVEVLAKTRYLLEENESRITFAKFSLQDYDSLVKFIVHSRAKNVDEDTVKAIVLDKLYLKTTIPVITATSSLIELVQALYMERKIDVEEFSRIRSRLYKHKTVFNRAVENVEAVCRDELLRIDIEGIRLVRDRSERLYRYVMDKIKMFEKTMIENK